MLPEMGHVHRGGARGGVATGGCGCGASCCLEAEVEMQLQRNSWRLWPTASQDAVSCLDAIIKQRQPLCSDTDSSTTQLRTLAHTHTPTHTRTGDVEVGQIGRDEKIVHMMRCHTSYLLFLLHSSVLR